MVWRETCALEERTRFIVDWQRSTMPMVALCEAYGISRKTGYKWRDRYLAGGFGGLGDASRARREIDHALSPATAAVILELRRAHPLLGPRKLKAILEREHPDAVWPAASTIGDLLRTQGLSEPRRRSRRPAPVTQPFAAVSEPNDLWSIDFKGWFRTRDGRRCDPLTVSDAESRYLLACRIVEPTLSGVQAACERLFLERGLPLRLRMDNGAPFASAGPAGLSRLSVWWLKLGIGLERMDPASPQQNGRHERMHGELKKHTSRPPADTLDEQQARFDGFVEMYNDFRPHEALEQKTPASRYRASTRPYPERLREPWYDAEYAVRRVRPNGEIKWGGDLVFVSEALAGELIGVCETQAGDWLLRFFDHDLGLVDRRTKKLFRFAAARPGRRKPEQTRKSVTHVPGPECHL